MAKRAKLIKPKAPAIIKPERVGNYFTRPNTDVKFIRSGSTLFDLALGGGWARGRISNIVGDKSTGKTLLCIEACANFVHDLRKKKPKIRYRECEAAFDKPYAKALGMPVEHIDFGSNALETVEDLFADLEKVVKGARTPELVVVDSLDALSDRAEMERDFEGNSFGAAKAKKMSELFRRLVRRLEEKDVTLIIVSQIRDKMNAMFGRKVQRTGGKALDFYASQVAFLAHTGRLTQTIRGQKRVTGVKIKAVIDKNKITTPHREAEFRIRFGYGVNDAQSMVDWLKSVKAKNIGVKEAEVKEYLDVLLEGDQEREFSELDRLSALCSEIWFGMEQDIAPARTKYGRR